MLMALTKTFAATALLLAALAASPAAAAPHTLDPNAYQSFIVNWTPDSAPLCAALRDSGDWDKLMHPAPLMGGNKPFGPDKEFWGHHSVLVFARVVPMGDATKVFTVDSLSTAAGTVTVKLATALPAPASSNMKAWLGIVVVKPLPARIRFVENGKPVCAVDWRTGKWVSPPLAP